MAKSVLIFSLKATGPGLTVTARIDDQEIYHGEPGEQATLVKGEFDDSIEIERSLTISLTGKLPEHTEISASGEIIRDRVVKISDICFDSVALGHVMTEKSIYTHNRNDTSEKIEEKFYGTMGCNGTVRLEFSSPVYIWLLENM